MLNNVGHVKVNDAPSMSKTICKIIRPMGQLRQAMGPPRSVAGVGVGMLIVLQFSGFMVLCFYGFTIFWFYGFMVYGFTVLWFSGCMISCFYVFKKCQMPISCFQNYIDPISKIFKILSNGCSSFVGARLFQIWSTIS